MERQDALHLNIRLRSSLILMADGLWREAEASGDFSVVRELCAVPPERLEALLRSALAQPCASLPPHAPAEAASPPAHQAPVDRPSSEPPRLHRLNPHATHFVPSAAQGPAQAKSPQPPAPQPPLQTSRAGGRAQEAEGPQPTSLGPAPLHTRTLLIRNLPQAQGSVVELGRLVSVYGRVGRVALWADWALVELSCPSEAHTASRALHGTPLWGRQIQVSLAPHEALGTPEEPLEWDDFAKDRGQVAPDRLLRPPSSELLISHIPAQVPQQELLRHLERLCSRPPLSFRSQWQASSHWAAWAEMASAEEAATALAGLRGKRLRPGLSPARLIIVFGP